METDTQSPGFNREVESGRFLTAVIVTGLLGIASFLVLPSLVLGFVTDLGFSELQVGRISTFQLIGLGLGSVASVLLLKYLDWRNLSRFGLALLLVSRFCLYADRGIYPVAGPALYFRVCRRCVCLLCRLRPGTDGQYGP